MRWSTSGGEGILRKTLQAFSIETETVFINDIAEEVDFGDAKVRLGQFKENVLLLATLDKEFVSIHQLIEVVSSNDTVVKDDKEPVFEAFEEFHHLGLENC